MEGRPRPVGIRGREQVDMKNTQRMWGSLVLLAVLAVLFAVPVQAKTVKAKKYALKNVTQAESPEGQWVTGKSSLRFQKTDGTYVKNRWICVENVICYMDSRGRRVSGWVSYRNRLYYMDSDGALHTGWLHRGKKTYYCGADGAVVKGLQTIDGEKYYFGKMDGVQKTGWVTIGKSRYYFRKSNGSMKTSSWIRRGKKYYYVDASGRMKKSGWLTLGDKKYYLDSDGARVTGKQFIDGKGYYFKKNGVYDPSVEVKQEVDPSRPMVALTFDDGPGKYTGRLLDCLEKNDAKATFFMVGSSVASYKDTVKRMADMGCELGNHSWSHPAFTTLSAAERQSQVSRTNEQIRSAAGKSPTVFRLPYGDGSSNASVLSSLGMPSIYWSVDTRDWANTGNSQHTVNAVLDSVRNGDIILMHDIHYSTVVAAETIIPALKKRGYQLVTVSQLAKYKGKTTLKSGTTYRGF